MTDELTERVAQAIQRARFGRVLRSLSEIDIEIARAAIEAYEVATEPDSDDFHPAQCMPSCMMPDGGECCAGYAALHDAYWKLRRHGR